MLHLETVEPSTFSLLEKLMKIEEMSNFHLVGGTALSLLYGHRISIDLDLFSNVKFEKKEIEDALVLNFGNDFVHEEKTSFGGIFCFIKNIKVDIVNYPHPNIKNTFTSQNIRMFSIEDIIAMKVQAILNRARKKDFWDIAELLNHYTVEQFIAFHKKKFATQHLLISIPQALVYFDDAEDDEDPISLKNQTWQSVQQAIKVKIANYLR